MPRPWLVPAVVTMLAICGDAHAFPPYRSTDADTADPWVLEGRVGLLRLTRDAGENLYATPLLRLNLGLPRKVELLAELEYVPELSRLADAAVGAKWIPLAGRHSFGVETLLLLPVSDEGGAGAEVSLLATYRRERYRLHGNATGFYDARPAPAENGWKASVLGELALGRLRPGLETQARQTNGGDVQLYAGIGAIVDLGRFDVRTGAHVGLNDASRDLVVSLWLASKVALR
jgi:hypothetical protein